MNKLETSGSYQKIAASLALIGEANIELACGEGKWTSVLIGKLGPGTPGVSHEKIRELILESIAINIEVLDSEEWTHLGELPEERIAKLRRAEILLPKVEG
jgi:hypothetical protein